MSLLFLGPSVAQAGEDEVRLAAPPGFQVRERIRLAPSQFTGGLLALPGGDLVIYNGASVVRHYREAGREPEALFTPAEPPVFGSFIRLGPDGRSMFFGETHTGDAPHRIYRLPLDPAVGPVEVVDILRFNFDLAFDGQGHGFVSSFAAGTDNRIYLLDHDPERPNEPVVVGIPGSSGPVAFHEGRLYCATALLEKGVNRLFYFTAAQIAAAIEEGRALDYATDLPPGQVVAEGLDVYFNLVFAGDNAPCLGVSRVEDRSHPGGPGRALRRSLGRRAADRRGHLPLLCPWPEAVSGRRRSRGRQSSTPTSPTTSRSTTSWR